MIFPEMKQYPLGELIAIEGCDFRMAVGISGTFIVVTFLMFLAADCYLDPEINWIEKEINLLSF